MHVPFRFSSLVNFSLTGNSTISMPKIARRVFCAPSKIRLKDRLCSPKTVTPSQLCHPTRLPETVYRTPLSLIPSLRIGVRGKSQAMAYRTSFLINWLSADSAPSCESSPTSSSSSSVCGSSRRCRWRGRWSTSSSSSTACLSTCESAAQTGARAGANLHGEIVGRQMAFLCKLC